ncbi:hypothetical protein B0H14DRAFT_3085987 [Mycena olivaceomarginata]|nr:hypothetical protein B0H14DRAFT_3085987 [Mycena olivaceomarginata]
MNNLHLRPARSAPMEIGDIELSRRDDCVNPDPADTVADRINTLLNSSGPGYVLNLCPNTEYMLQSPLLFAAPNQEISTEGYPTDDSRATLVVDGPVANGTGHTTAINGARDGAPPTGGGGNIEMGGGNANQTVQFVRSYNPRGWTCLHIVEGPYTCTNTLVQNNDIGPCGVDTFQEWADGISVSCRDSIVRNNMIQGATDGGIVLFGSPGTQVYNNTIWITNNTLLGGINMVDYQPWKGDFTNTVVRNNTIIGGFATGSDAGSDSLGPNEDDVFIKIAIAIGPRTWFGDAYGSNFSFSGVVEDNHLTGAFGYGIAVTSAVNFTVQNNVLVGNTSFIGVPGDKCSETMTLQPDFQLVADASSLTCIAAPTSGDYWPFGSDPGSATGPGAPTISDGSPTSSETVSFRRTSPTTAGIASGVLLGVAALGVAAWFVRKWALRRAENKKLYTSSRGLEAPGFVKHG